MVSPSTEYPSIFPLKGHGFRYELDLYSMVEDRSPLPTLDRRVILPSGHLFLSSQWWLVDILSPSSLLESPPLSLTKFLKAGAAKCLTLRVSELY
ncbi:hypothetical protein ETSB_0009 [cyanobacterium endosymbiont of Epithemia turgida isolate EtSB Lake Yunoko]|nr:hypothetical protein [cyanobacterium endosymbiont of Epithemia turgida]BAP16917.1 hypothetical protein ETSB_0009 [cyanobacterium endosymbiont of Epithemia turgida isolate EtSB Lake Yunoko]